MSDEVIGITTTIPVEVLLAAGVKPLDLNNVFITHPDAERLVLAAERDGYPTNVCGWIKGIYATALQMGIKRVIAVTQGDCSQTHAMMETLQAQGVEIIPFAFPYDRNATLLRAQLQELMDRFGVSWEQCEQVRASLAPLRRLVARIDEATWREGRVTGFENHYYQVCCSDFCGDVEAFTSQVTNFWEEVQQRPCSTQGVRIGLIGVPPIFTDIHDVLEQVGARVVFHEVQRQFTMAPSIDCDLLTQYLNYTYPYDVFGRIRDINEQVQRRNIVGLIHYTQAFCFRRIQDLLIKRGVSVPVLTIEGDRPGAVDARTRVRIEAFVEMLQGALSFPS